MESDVSIDVDMMEQTAYHDRKKNGDHRSVEIERGK